MGRAESGKVFLEGREGNLGEVKKALGKAQPDNGVVWYYRENGESEPPPQAMEIVKLILERNLPISVSTKPDFLDYIGDENRSRLRE